MFGYWVGQFVGALGASLMFAWVLDRFAVATSYTYVAQPTVEASTGFIAEAIFTMVLAASFLVLAKSQAHTKYLGMGITLAALTFIGLRFTGASMNPFRSLAPAIVGDSIPGFPFGSAEAWWVFIVGPFLGAILGWVVYKFVVEGDTDLMDDFSEIKDSVT
jgi:glycerol uptake facilitator-like aquaporin